MCGIAGFSGQRDIAPSVLDAMLAPLRARGPDAAQVIPWNGQWLRGTAPTRSALLHTRLSIRDLRAVADQPMTTAAEDVWICYNGEVYGWQAAAQQLREEGVCFRTGSDTEFILYAYARWGMPFLQHLRGMFAIALLDLRQRKLLLIRDRLGIKPLVYAHQPGELVFASTVRALLPYLPNERRLIAPAGIDAYLAHRYIPAPYTIFQEVFRLLPGHWAEFDLDSGTLRHHTYWVPHPTESPQNTTQLLREAVALRTESDRPLGLFLSGGVDSSCMASALAHTGETNFTAFTASFPGSSLDESQQAEKIAQHLGFPHRVIPCLDNLGSDFEQLVADLDEPFADPSAIPLWYLARETKKEVASVLGGDGGDELFAGYKRYAKHVARSWRGAIKLPRRRFTSSRLPGRWEKILDELGMGWQAAYALRFSGMSPALRDFLQPDFLPSHLVYWRPLAPDGNRPTPLQTLLALDFANYLPEYILRKADLCTMAHGLELRVPMLDHRLVENTFALPDSVRFTQPAKLALAEVCSVCRELELFSQPKRGFNPPLLKWLKHDLVAYLPGLGRRLQQNSQGQLRADRVDSVRMAFERGEDHRAEQVLQLLILDVALRQLGERMSA